MTEVIGNHHFRSMRGALPPLSVISGMNYLWTTLFLLLIVLPACQHSTPADRSSSVAEPAVSPLKKAAPSTEKGSGLVNSIGMELTRIPAGSFFMGSAPDEPGARDDELPQHRVEISKAFYIGNYEVTQHEFKTVMQTNPSSFTREGLLQEAAVELDTSRLPVDNVTWFSALEFCQRLSNLPAEKEAGRVYRLPSEAEWEYACRAGTTTQTCFGNSLSSHQANFNGKHPFGSATIGPFLNRTSPVGSYAPNAFGLYDMHGNLNEWCLDKFDRSYYARSPLIDPSGPQEGSSPVIRGGDWYSDGRDCRSAFRYADIPEGRFYALGMRAVCELRSDGAELHPLVAGAGGTQPAKDFAVTNQAAPEKPQPLAGEDWPRWRGPRGDGTWHAPPLPATWPPNGLRKAWQAPIGGGYGGVSVSQGRVFVMDRQSDSQNVERVLCWDAVNGALLWSHAYPVEYAGVSYDNGPRSTPTVHQGRVYTLGAVGHLICLDALDGSVLWSKDLARDFSARVPLWGLSASPLVFEESLIVHSGAVPNGCLIAFDLQTGNEHWRCLADDAGYATPLIIQRQGKPEMITWTPSNVHGINPRTGDVLWTIPFEVNFGTSIASPIFQEGIALVSSYYDGSKAIQLGDLPTSAEVLWHDRRDLRGLMAQPLYRDGHAFLLDKRHGLTCFELASGKKKWDDDNRLTPKGRNPQATTIWVNDGDRALTLNSDGDLILIRLNASGYHEDSRTNIIGRTWAHAAYAGNCVYARSDSHLVCVVLTTLER